VCLLALAPLTRGQERVAAGELDSLARDQDAVVVTVGDIELHRSDVFRVLDLATPGKSAEVIRQMVLTTAAQLDAQAEGIDVPAEELERQITLSISEQKASFALEVDETMPLEEYLELRHGISPVEYQDEVRRMVLASMLLERAVRLDQMRSARDELAVIVVEDEALAREIADKLSQGASFSALARQHSIHPSSTRGGEVPPLFDDVELPLLAGRATLQPGEVLGPAAITLGGQTYWRLVRLIERNTASAAPWSELREQIEAELTTRPLDPDELALFEARVIDRYRVNRPPRNK
jgi:hypothetical protein